MASIADSSVSFAVSGSLKQFQASNLKVASLSFTRNKFSLPLRFRVACSVDTRSGSLTRDEDDNAHLVYSMPPWGVASIYGRRHKLEDEVVVIPQFPETSATSRNHLQVLFLAVYDGHGGSQVVEFCRDWLHDFLYKEIPKLDSGPIEDVSEEEWRSAFTNCFCVVDDEVGGRAHIGPHNASDSVGSTAVVAIVCQSYIVVANCGDSRAVLKRDQECIPLSLDHKPTREDEHSRIEAAGGKVKKWNPGNGEQGVIEKFDNNGTHGYLGVSRSIGDGYFKPFVIPDPEVKFISRSKGDKCLVLACDGLWDVMTSKEVCDIASERILNWYARNGHTLHIGRPRGLESASQAAAEYLAQRAFEKGSKDNISVLVVDLESLPCSNYSR